MLKILRMIPGARRADNWNQVMGVEPTIETFFSAFCTRDRWMTFVGIQFVDEQSLYGISRLIKLTVVVSDK